jgi:hypothetical protein
MSTHAGGNIFASANCTSDHEVPHVSLVFATARRAPDGSTVSAPNVSDPVWFAGGLVGANHRAGLNIHYLRPTDELDWIRAVAGRCCLPHPLFEVRSPHPLRGGLAPRRHNQFNDSVAMHSAAESTPTTSAALKSSLHARSGEASFDWASFHDRTWSSVQTASAMIVCAGTKS